jgi:hypothetical protein
MMTEDEDRRHYLVFVNQYHYAIYDWEQCDSPQVLPFLQYLVSDDAATAPYHQLKKKEQTKKASIELCHHENEDTLFDLYVNEKGNLYFF